MRKIFYRATAVALAAVTAAMCGVPALYTLLSVWRLDVVPALLFGLMAATMAAMLGVPMLAASVRLWQSGGRRNIRRP